MQFKIVLSLLFLSLFMVSCGSQKRVIKKKKNSGYIVKESIPTNLPSVKQIEHIQKLKKSKLEFNKNKLNYIKKYAPIAVKEMHKYHIPASITLAQGILESASGKGKLAKKSNNHFGIKCHSKWRGERVYHDDDERGECFRKYTYIETSYEDHSIFLSSKKRYAFLFKLKQTNYKSWAKGLKKAGYATDWKYPQKLIEIIENYRLYEFDKIKKRKKTSNNKITQKEIYKVQKGDTLYSISQKFGLSVLQLKKQNGLINNNLNIGQELVLK